MLASTAALLVLVAPRLPGRRTAEPSAVTVILPPAAATPAAKRAAAAAPRRSLDALSRQVPSTARPAAAARAESPPIGSVEPTPSAVERAASSAPPLKLDALTIQRAIAGSQGQVRGMARGSGVELDSRRATQAERLSTAVAESVKPDCLGPNAGGSLLSIPAIAFAAIGDRCR